ncbi:multiple epidermal growth factor-like domains protein 6 [Mytilus edulis]|uniref:multiple epidermal growth factor-like domains protein 6 n=1 Tax=Mytilus edulis TaxID=6550 RepID=UPI0039EFA43E
MSFVLIIHSTVLLTITSQKNLTPFGQASQSSTLQARTKAINAIQPPISNTFINGYHIYCTHTDGYQDTNPQPAWWMFAFSFESAYITEIQIYYRENQASRMDGFKLYVTNTSTIPPVGYLCYEDGPGLPNTTQSIPCNQLGKYVIYYDDKGSVYTNGYLGPLVELCYVAINGCQKSRWGSNCEQFCPENCIERNCFPQNGSCVWGCDAKNCLSDICDKDTSVCTNGCKHRRTGIYCNNYNIAYDSLVWQDPSGSQPAEQAKDGDITTCSKTIGSSVKFQIDLKEKSIVTGLFIILGDGTTTEGYNTVYASNTSNTWSSEPVLYNGTSLPNEIHFESVFRFLTFVLPVGNLSTELELCEIGIIGCPPTHYGPLCNITCPQNCKGPCDLDLGHCTFGCIDGWTGISCEQVCHAGFYGKDCLEICSATCLNPPCHHVTGECIGGCQDGWQSFNCSQECPYGQFGRNCSGFCDGCIARTCHHVSGLCDNSSACNYGYKYSQYCDTACEGGYFGDNCTLKCNCLTGTCNSLTGKCSKDVTKSRHEETSNAAAIGGGAAAFIIAVLIIVAAFIVYKRRLISSQDGVHTTTSDTTTYETRNNTNNSQQKEQQYEDLIRMDLSSPYQDLTSPSVSNEYEQIDNAYVNLSLQI